MLGGGTQQILRKALGALKDTITVSITKVNIEYNDLDIAIVKATNHVERLAKEKHIRIIFAATSATRPREDVVYCIHALARRLAKTHNWAVSRESIKLYTAINDVTINLVDKVSRENIKLYTAINDATINLVDKFFEMQCHEAIKALDIYRRASKHAEKLSEFYEVCKGLDLGHGFKFPTLEQSPASFISGMEEYVKDAPRSSSVCRELVQMNSNRPSTVQMKGQPVVQKSGCCS